MAKKPQKSETQIAEEKAEMERLSKEILSLTDRIPAKVMNETGFYGAQTFKAVAMNARRVAQSTKPNLERLRSSRSALTPYYG